MAFDALESVVDEFRGQAFAGLEQVFAAALEAEGEARKTECGFQQSCSYVHISIPMAPNASRKQELVGANVWPNSFANHRHEDIEASLKSTMVQASLHQIVVHMCVQCEAVLLWDLITQLKRLLEAPATTCQLDKD